MTHRLDHYGAVAGDLNLFGACEHPENAILGVDDRGMVDFIEGRAALNEAPPWMKAAVRKYGHLIVLSEPNGFVNNGLDVFLNKAFAVGGPPANLQCLITAKSAANVASTDTSILGGATAPVFTGATQNAFSKVFGTPAAATAVANAITVGITFTQADITGGANYWPMNRIGVVNVAAATNLGLIDVIGNNAAQADPYSRTFSIDFSGAGSFTLNPQITITGVRRTADFPTL